jgi:uncharacterized protein YecE (DUF72 family)
METCLQAEPAIHIGTCAWSFEDWRGAFYPEGLQPTQRLAFYARHFNSVEIDSTFYSPPSEHAAKNWVECTPDDFVFACKMPRAITHDRKLRDCDELLHGFLKSIEPLAPKLRAVLIQLPPYFTLKHEELALREFILGLPAGFRYAVEFRDMSWHLPRIAHLLEEHRVCWTWNDITPLEHQAEAAFDFLPVTTDFLYVRLLGDLEAEYGDGGDRIHRYRHLMWPRDSAVESWAIKIRQHQEAVENIYIYVNNHYEGFSPLTCRRIGAALGIDLQLPAKEVRNESEKDGGQLELFEGGDLLL